jgi:hypothetical protein
MQVSSDIATKEKPPFHTKSFPTRQKIDVKKAFILRYVKGFTESEVARELKVARASINYALKPFKGVIEHFQPGQVYRDNKPVILDAIEMSMVSLLTDKAKQKKATLGNVAYALDKVNNINRLERGLATTIVSNCDLTPEERETLRVLEARIISHDPQDVVITQGQENIQNNDVNNINEIQDDLS